MNNIQLIDNELIEELYKKATNNERKRINFDLRTSKNDKSQRMLNVLEVGTDVPIHRHTETTETVICIQGKLEEIFYIEQSETGTKSADQVFKEISRITLCPRKGVYGVQVPIGMWHKVNVLEQSVIFEAKDGEYKKKI